MGYQVERVKVTENGGFEGGYQRLTTTPIKPWTLEQWRQYAKPDNKFAGIAAQVLYGKSVAGAGALQNKTVDALKAAADEFSNRHGFALFAADNDPVAAEGLGLRYVDKNVKLGERYVYRVFLASQDTAYFVDTAYLVQEVTEHETAPPPTDLTAEGRDGRIVLNWEEFPGHSYSGYYVYRAEPGSSTFKQITPTPVVSITPYGAKEKAKPQYHDTTIVNYKKYRYQVKGVNSFSELSQAAEVEAYGRDLKAPNAPDLKEPKQLGKHRVKLEWEMPNPSPDLAGFVIARSASSVMGFVQITDKPLSKTTRTYIDEEAGEEAPYYMLGAVDTAGNVAPSHVVYAFIIDSLPPSIPTGLSGTVDSNGIVRLKWNLGPEADIIGYRVLWANDPTHEFTQRTPAPIKDTTFVDTISLHSLTKYVYYRIAAVDQRYNHSQLSPMIAIARPDTVAPEASVFKNVVVTENSVILNWVPSRSNDVAKQVLYKRKEGETSWNKFKEFSASTNQYTDTNVVQSTMYEYELETIDSAGLHSVRAMGARGRPYDTKVRPGVDAFNARYDSVQKSVVLKWNYKDLKEDYWFIVYKSIGNYEVTSYRSVKPNELQFLDNSLPAKGTYKYAVKVRTATGGESILSPVITVAVP